ncbi:zinc-binding alcohol dehydrogenase, partial [Escherichia coli]
VAAGLGAHQPNRRLRLAAEPQTGRREVSALTDARKTLAYDFFRILRAPLVGLGAIGQIAIQLAKRAGASVVIGVDPIAHRCDIARRHGADFCLNPIGTDVGKEIKTLTGKQGADVIIETSGYADALQSALRGLAYGGTISYVAFAKPFAEGFNLGREAHFNNAKIVFSRACSEPNPDYPRWSRKRIEETCWELLMNGYLNCEDLIDPVVTFANSPESYMQYVDQHPEQSIKMGVTF